MVEAKKRELIRRVEFPLASHLPRAHVPIMLDKGW